MRYLINKHGAGGSLRDQLIKNAVASVNKTGRSYNTTVQSAAMNSQLKATSINKTGERYYPIATILTGNFESTAGE